MAGGKAPARSSSSVSFTVTFGVMMSFLLSPRWSFASCYFHSPILITSPPFFTFVSLLFAAAPPFSSPLALSRYPAEAILLPSFTFTDAGSPPLKSSDLQNPFNSFARLLSSLQDTHLYDVLFTPIVGSLMSFIGMSLALLRFITAVCSLCSVDIGNLWVGLLSASSCLNRPMFSASSCSNALMLPIPVASCCCYDFTCVCVNDTLFAFVQSSTAVCSLLHVFTPNYDVIRWLSLPLWQCEELVIDISTQPLNLVVFSIFSFMELVVFPYSPLVFSGCVAGSIVSKLTDTLLSSFRKGLANWSHVAYALTAEFLIVYLTPDVVSIFGFRALYVLSKSFCSISSSCIIGSEDRGLLNDFNCLAMMFAHFLAVFVLRFVIAVCLAGLALLSSTLNNCSIDGV